jgi:predicted HTH domain antitoxin
MQIQIALPDNVAHSLEAKWGNLERKLLEILVIQAYVESSISVGKVRELLGMSTRLEVDAFLKAKDVDLQYDETDLESDRQIHNQLRQEGKSKPIKY